MGIASPWLLHHIFPCVSIRHSIIIQSLSIRLALSPYGLRLPDAHSDPGLPTDQSLAPPAMLARADSRPDFTLGFGLDVPDEAGEEDEETEQEEQAMAEVLEEERMLVEAPHIAVTGADDTIDMELGAEGAEVCIITTAAQSRAHPRHVSRLSPALSLRSVGGTRGLS